jgi:hypothetical protein
MARGEAVPRMHFLRFLNPGAKPGWMAVSRIPFVDEMYFLYKNL